MTINLHEWKFVCSCFSLLGIVCEDWYSESPTQFESQCIYKQATPSYIWCMPIFNPTFIKKQPHILPKPPNFSPKSALALHQRHLSSSRSKFFFRLPNCTKNYKKVTFSFGTKFKIEMKKPIFATWFGLVVPTPHQMSRTQPQMTFPINHCATNIRRLLIKPNKISMLSKVYCGYQIRRRA